MERFNGTTELPKKEQTRDNAVVIFSDVFVQRVRLEEEKIAGMAGGPS